MRIKGIFQVNHPGIGNRSFIENVRERFPGKVKYDMVLDIENDGIKYDDIKYAWDNEGKKFIFGFQESNELLSEFNRTKGYGRRMPESLMNYKIDYLETTFMEYSGPKDGLEDVADYLKRSNFPFFGSYQSTISSFGPLKNRKNILSDIHVLSDSREQVIKFPLNLLVLGNSNSD